MTRVLLHVYYDACALAHVLCHVCSCTCTMTRVLPEHGHGKGWSAPDGWGRRRGVTTIAVETVVESLDDERPQTMDAQLEVYDAHVVIDRALGQSQTDGHAHAGMALYHQRYDLDLAGGEPMLSEGVGFLCHDIWVFREVM